MNLRQCVEMYNGPPFRGAVIPGFGSAIPGVRHSGAAIPGSVRQSDVCLWSSKVIEPRVDDKKHASKLCDGLPEEWSTDLSSMCCAWKIGNSHKVTSSIGRPTRNSSVEINLQLLVILHFLVINRKCVHCFPQADCTWKEGMTVCVGSGSALDLPISGARFTKHPTTNLGKT